MQLVDTHAHLNFKAFSKDYLAVAKRSRESSVRNIVIPGSDPQTSLRALEIAREINKEFPNFARIAPGIHAVHTDRVDFSVIEQLSEEPETVAIGESGIDFFHDVERKTEKEQIELFKKHIDLAISRSLPLIIHNRNADETVKEIIEHYPDLKKAVLHCFSTDHNLSKWAVERGFMLSFTGNITYGNKKIKKAIERTPIDRIMIETDAPYNVPEPLRSEGIKINEPRFVIEVARKIAQIKNLELEEVVEQTTKNAIEFFNL
jgi:TatD DNase family protein